jgi:hypothetical protein
VATVGLQGDRALDGELDHLLPPGDGGRGRNGAEVPQLDGLDGRVEHRDGAQAGG